MHGAHDVSLDAFVLRNPRLIDALESAAESGAHVTVRLGDPKKSAQRSANLEAARALKDHGVHVAIQPGYGPDAIHDKIAVVDGTVFRDDRNWTTGCWETVLIEDRLSGDDRATTKHDALAREAALIRHGKGHDIIASTESLGPGPIVEALIERAKRGDRVCLMYSPATKDRGRGDALRRLHAAGVKVRRSRADHKICAVGSRAWIGSANATAGAAGLHEWGQIVGGDLAAQLRRTLEYVWATAKR